MKAWHACHTSLNAGYPPLRADALSFAVTVAAVTLGLGAVLAGCASRYPAPVSERTVPGKAPPASARPDPVIIERKAEAAPTAKPLMPTDGPTHAVRAGDTLFSIAKANAMTVRDIAAWNNLDDGAGISVGQVLRLTPPGGVAVAPVKPPGGIEARPLGPGAEGAPAGADGGIKTQPLAQRIPYSEQAYAQMAKVVLPPKPEMKPEPKAQPDAAAKADTKPDAKPAAKPDAAAAAPAAAGNGEWIWPTEGKVIGNFNASSNKGITIAGKRGQPVVASAGGRVIFSGSGVRGLGRFVVIRHNNNYLSVYAHNEKLLVKEGQNVTKGQRIAEMGSTDTDSVKLHFEIRRQGKPVDPARLLPGT
jgi:lipoprotein NlpD